MALHSKQSLHCFEGNTVKKKIKIEVAVCKEKILKSTADLMLKVLITKLPHIQQNKVVDISCNDRGMLLQKYSPANNSSD